MTKARFGGRTVFADDPDEDDTIEMELSPEDMRRFARAAEEHHLSEQPVEPTPHSSSEAGLATFEREPSGAAGSATMELEALAASTPSQTTVRRKPPKGVSSATLGRGALAGAAGALVVVLAIASWSAAHRTILVETTSPPVAQQAAATPPSTTTAVPTTSTASQQAAATAAPSTAAPDFGPLRIKNPFDRSEVFEFPPGTTREEARQSVADVLMQRARDRHVQIGTPSRHRVSGPGSGRPAKNTDLAQNTVLRR